MENEFQQQENLKENKNAKRNWLIPLIVVAVLVVVIGGYFGYFYLYRNTDKYLEKFKNDIALDANKLFANVNESKLETSDVTLTDDFKLKGNLELTLQEESILNVDYDLVGSIENELFSVDLDLKDGVSSLVKLGAFLQDNKVYFNSSNLYKNGLMIDLTDELSMDIPEFNVDVKTKLSVDDIKYFVLKILEYHVEALKEADLSTKAVGLDKKEYIIKLDEKNLEKVNEKLKSLVDNDTRMQQIIENYNIENYNLMQAGTLIITVKTFDDEFVSLRFENEDNTWTVTHDDEKYVFKDDKGNSFNIYIDDESLKMESYSNDVLTSSFVLKFNDEGMNIDITDGEEKFSFVVKKTDEKTCELSLEVKNSEVSGNATVIFKEISDDVFSITGNFVGEVDGETFGLNLVMNVLTKENLIDKKDFAGYQNVESLTEDDQNEIMMNIYNLFQSLGILDIETEN